MTKNDAELCDMKIYLRSCEEEVIKPIDGKLTGDVPQWLRGSLLRNGPGAIKVGTSKYQHLFDGLALLHRFAISPGTVTYQCRFLQSDTYKKNKAANRIVVTEFGTQGVPDPCHTIFDRISSVFNPADHMTDNALVSVYPFGDEIYTITEVPIISRIDPVSLETLDRKNLVNHLVVNHTSHPHVMANGDVYNMGIAMQKGIVKHVVVKFPREPIGDTSSMVDRAEIVGSTNARWFLNPGYMHSFGITQNYFVMIDQPLAVSVIQMMKRNYSDGPFKACLKWYPDCETHVVLISRHDGKEYKRYRMDTLFYFHVINAFEKDGKLTIDLCTYKDAQVIDSFYLEAMENSQNDINYASSFRSRPKRIEVDLTAPNLTKVEPTLIVDIGCELPRINQNFNARWYRYFYAIATDTEPRYYEKLIKVDTVTGEVKMWHEPDCLASEPIFLPAPDAKDEDDGVILSALLWNARERSVALLVLDARTFQEIARAHFDTPSPSPKCFHGWFLPTTQ